MVWYKLNRTLVLGVFFTIVLSSPLPHTERTCGKDKKIKVSETILPSPQVDDYQLYFVSDNNQIVYLRTKDGHVYRSADEGYTWTKQTVNSIMSHIENEENGISQIFHTQAKDGAITLYFLGNGKNGRVWVSSNGGQSYKYNDTMPSSIYDLYMHPMFPGVVLGFRNVGDSRELYLGTDFGSTWKKLVGNLPRNSKAGWSIFPDTNPNRIYLLRNKDNSKSINNGEIVYSDNWFETTTILNLQYVRDWHIYSPNKFVVETCADNFYCQEKQLQISTDGGKTFHLAVFPDYREDTPSEKSFYVWEISDETVWVYVGRDTLWGDEFHSTSTEDRFSLSLQYQKKWDFTKYQSVEGIYIANQYITTEDGEPESTSDVRTLITYNKGGLWEIVKAPKLDANEQPTDCKIEDECSLHIHGFSSSTFGYFYSVPNAVGIMIATGNTGKRLQEDKMNTYLSTNGGVEWKEVKKGAWVPEIGDHGSIIVMAQQNTKVNEVSYTIDDADTWETCQFTDSKLLIKNIRVSQGWDSKRFIAYGQLTSMNSSNAVIVHLNFDDTFRGKCTAKDLVTWSPTSEHGKCVMGRSIYYQKRKKGVDCYLGEEHKINTTEKSCACSADDYECDHCFYRPDLSSPCTLECTVDGLPETEPAICQTESTDPQYYEVDLGYRLVAGDKCDPNMAGAEKPNGRVPCNFRSIDGPSAGAVTSKIIYMAILTLAIIIIVASIFIALFKKNERFYNFVSNRCGIVDENRGLQGSGQGDTLTDNTLEDPDLLDVALEEDDTDSDSK